MNTIRIFRSQRIERGNGKPGYDWHEGFSQKLDNGSVSMPLTLSEWRGIAKRDGAKLLKFETEREAAGEAPASDIDRGERETTPGYDC